MPREGVTAMHQESIKKPLSNSCKKYQNSNTELMSSKPENKVTVEYLNIERDGDQLWEMYTDPEYKEFFRDLGSVWNRDALMNSDDIAQVFFYTIRYNGEFVGFVCLSGTKPFVKSVNLGIVMLKKWHDYRVGKKHKLCFLAMRKIGEILFEEQAFNRVICTVLSHRQDLADGLINAGFHYEGYLEKSVFLEGKYLDECQFALLAKPMPGSDPP